MPPASSRPSAGQGELPVEVPPADRRGLAEGHGGPPQEGVERSSVLATQARNAGERSSRSRTAGSSRPNQRGLAGIGPSGLMAMISRNISSPMRMTWLRVPMVSCTPPRGTTHPELLFGPGHAPFHVRCRDDYMVQSCSHVLASLVLRKWLSELYVLHRRTIRIQAVPAFKPVPRTFLLDLDGGGTPPGQGKAVIGQAVIVRGYARRVVLSGRGSQPAVPASSFFRFFLHF